MNILYNTCNYLQKLTLKTFSNYKVTGRENIPPMGPLLIVSNHMSDIDPSILATAIPRRLKFLAKDTLFIGFPISQILLSYGAYPLSRKKADIKAIRWAKKSLGSTGTVVIFPEGTRNGGSMIQGKQGVARLIQMTESTILPVGITGTEKFKSVFRVFNPTGKITVNIGTPFSLPTLEGNITNDVMKSMTDIIMMRISELLPEKYRGIYSLNKKGRDN
jgi:1-acyl-sn-glycerol-3-phosphate acyltransferase|tara:strand:+ start:870 stop:1523 length:654 start_codon:yes stop_codon:yes gene_type:complete